MILDRAKTELTMLQQKLLPVKSLQASSLEGQAVAALADDHPGQPWGTDVIGCPEAWASVPVS